MYSFFNQMSTVNNCNLNNGDVNIVNQQPKSSLKRTLSNLSNSSESSISDSEIKRKKVVSTEWEPKKKNGVNVTAVLKKFRNRNVVEAKARKNISDIRVLSLWFVFPVNTTDTSKSISTYTREEEEAEFEPEAEFDGYVKGLVTHFSNTNQPAVKANSEASFINKFLMSVLSTLLLNNSNNQVIYSMIDGSDSSTKKLGVKIRKSEFFFIEIKRPGQESKYQPEDDFVKLMKQIKLSVDGQLSLGFINPFSYGLLIEGFRCSLYKMKMEGDGLYISMLVKRFLLVEEAADIMNIPSIVQALTTVKQELVKLRNKSSQPRSNQQKRT